MGSRGAQPLFGRNISPRRVSILGLARSPTDKKSLEKWLDQVSILGLARSPTIKEAEVVNTIQGFNTWAREEPNLPPQ